jgi:hypothetical protein
MENFHLLTLLVFVVSVPLNLSVLLFRFLSSLEKKPLIALFGGMGKKPLSGNALVA